MPSARIERSGSRLRMAAVGGRCAGLIGLFTGSLLLATVALAAESVPAASALPPTDQSVEALLGQARRQIMSGHMIAPPSDNAMDTWMQVLEAVSPPSADTLKTVTAFVEEMRRDAAEEQSAGRPMVAADLLIFATFAAELLGLDGATEPRAGAPDVIGDRPSADSPAETASRDVQPGETPGDTASPAETASHDVQAGEIPSDTTAPAETASHDVQAGGIPSDATAPVETASRDVQAGGTPSDTTTPVEMASRDVQPAGSPSDTGALAQSSAVSTAAAASPAFGAETRQAAIPAPAAAVGPAFPPPVQEHPEAALYAGRGDAMLAIKDISGARKFYEYAANAGSARAATALAQTYDPGFVAQLGAVGLRPDPALAADWYRKAAALGDRVAAARLLTLGAEATR